MAASPCATCPWLARNQTAEARAASPRAKGERYRWYDVPNLRRLWSGYRTGHPTVCHSTDGKATDYGGKAVAHGHERMCIGGLILVARCMDVVNERARQPVGKLKPWAGLFTRGGMLYWAEAFMFRGSGLGPSTSLMPTTFDGTAARDVRVPWDDEILNAGAK